MKKKVLSFITDGKKFLALRNDSKDPKHGGDFWFIVTGSVEGSESPKEAVKREISEETALETEEIINLKWGSIYHSQGQEFIEQNYLAFVKPEKISLNEEHIDYKWLDLEEFVGLIKWEDDKNLLKKVLKKAIKKEAYFKENILKDYRN